MHNKLSQKLIVPLIGVLVFMSQMALPTKTFAASLFLDGFEASTFSAGGWELSPTSSNKWHNVAAGDAHGGNKVAKVTGDTGDNVNYLVKKISTAGYNNISIEFWYKVVEEIAGSDDWVEVRWRPTGTPTTWQPLAGTKIHNEVPGTWKKITATFPSGANDKANFEFSFAAYLRSPGSDKDEVRIDDVSLTGTSIVVNQPPVLGAIGDKTVNELSLFTFTATATDDGLPSGTLTYSLTDTPPAGAAISSTGVFMWTPTETQGPGSYPTTIQVSDGASTDSETITITVNEVNIAPTATGQLVSTNKDTPILITLSAADPDLPVNSLTYSIVTDPTNGTLVAVVGNQVTYSPNSNYNGPDSFTFKVTDNGVPPLDSASATVSITVTDPGPTCTDNDGDGYYEEGGQCEPVDCNDNNSDSWRIDSYWYDGDSDTYHGVYPNSGSDGKIAICYGTNIPTGYTEITSGEDCDDTNPELNISCEVQPNGVISGMKINDKNRNGNQDEGEEYLVGWVIELKNQADELLATATTTLNGYQFTGREAGTYKVCEVMQSGWENTSPLCVKVTLTEQNMSQGPDFFNYQPGSLTIYKYNDLNGNGARDEGETFLSGWEVFISAQHYQYEGPERITDSDGKFVFSNLIAGTYNVCEVMQSGWNNTQPGYPAFEWTEGMYVVCDEQVVLSEGEDKDFYFGNRQTPQPTGKIFAFKYNDLNGNGYHDFMSDIPGTENEPYLGGWTVTISGNSINDSCVTGDSGEDLGRCIFENLPVGNTYTVCEVQQNGWERTQPVNNGGCYDVSIENTGAHNRYFGNRQIKEPILGCTNPSALNYNQSATQDNGTCQYSSGGGGGGGGGFICSSPKPETVNVTYIGDPGTGVITLNLTYPETVTQIAISNTSDFLGVNFESAVASKSWTLSSTSGPRAVYVKFRETNGCTAEKSIIIGGAPAVLGEITAPRSEGRVLGVTTCQEMIGKYIKYGFKNDPTEVKKLQQFLNNYLGVKLSTTGYYGPATRAAVKQFQLKHNKEVLAPWVPYGLPNDKTATGYVYKTTLRWINMTYCPALNLPTPKLP
jgi:hypothetical protein